MKLTKRIISLALVFATVLGLLPFGGGARAANDTDLASLPKGMTVSAGSSLITVTVKDVGTSGTATLYRTDANEYAPGDTLSGKSEETSVTGTVIGEYSCGTTQEFHINRYLSDGSDNLYSKYYLVQNGTVLWGPVYATEIRSLRDKPAFSTHTKKGVTLEDSTTIEIAKEMGAGNTVINMNLSELIVASENADGTPRDLSSRSDLVEFECNGKTYYFKDSYIKAQDGLISAYSKAGMNVTLVVISWVKTTTADYPRSLMYFEQTNRQTLAFDTSNELGMEYWIAAMEFIADRYSQSSNIGLVDKYIIGNEIDYTYDWYLLEPLAKNSSGHYYAVDMDVFMEEYARTLRLANLAVKKYNASAKVCVSLTHNWALNSAEAYNAGKTSVRQNSYRPKEIVDWLVKYEGERGNYDWGLAVHPYPVGTTSSNPIKTDVAGTYGKKITGDPDTSPWITVANLELYQLYLERPENRYNGEVRTVSLTETSVCNVAPGSANYETAVKEQAASIAQTYYRAACIPCIDQIAYFQPHDQSSYKLGLMTSDGVKKPSYEVWSYIDTDKSFIFANKYLSSIAPGATDYSQLMEAVESDFDWDTMWDEDFIITRETQSGSSERTLSVNKKSFSAKEPILVTASGDIGDTVELFLASDDISSAAPIYSYPVVGTHNGQTMHSGKTYDILAYGDISTSRMSDADLAAGSYKVVLRRGDTGSVLTQSITLTSDYGMGTSAYYLSTDKAEYSSGESIIVSASGNTACWAGLYRTDDAYGPGNATSIFWYYVNDTSAGQLSGKPTILQNTIHNTNSSNPGLILTPGEYVIYLFDGSGGNDYNKVREVFITVTEADLEALTGISYTLDDPTDGFANGTVTVTKDPNNDSAKSCVMYWADASGNPLEGYGALAAVPLTGVTTEARMTTHTPIPMGAEKLIAFASNGAGLSTEYVSAELPDNCCYDLSEKPLAEFQIVSDTHITTDSGATGEVRDANKHFTMMLEDIRKNSTSSIGIFISGDVVNTGTSAEYNKLLSLYSAANTDGTLPELHLAIGNHDWMAGNPQDQFQMYATIFNSNLSEQPSEVYYAEEVNGVSFIYLGGEQDGLRAVLSDNQLTWFDEQMKALTEEDPDKPVFVLLHQSFYNTVAGSLPGQGWDGVANENELKSIMKKYGQIILLNGHSHWEMNSESNMFPGDSNSPTALNTASVGYLWTSATVASGEFLDGTQGYYVRVYEDKVVFLGRDFENNKFLPSATYIIRPNAITGVEDSYDITVEQSALSLNAGSLSGGTVSYHSSDSDVAVITDDGTVIAKQPGTVTVTLTASPTDTTVIGKKSLVINITEDTNDYTVTFLDYDGTEISTQTCRYGDTVTVPPAPTRPEDDENTYVFAGWDKPITVCNGNATYTATYTAHSKSTSAFRIYGATRYDTAIGTAEILKEKLGVEKFENVVVACGTDFADALSGSYLAGQKNAPLLLVRSQNTEQIKTYIRESLVPGGTVYLLGGTNAIPAKMETGLDGFTVKRLSGATRYDTNLSILREAGVEGKDILVCSGLNFADGLSASAVNLPILLVKDNLNSSQKSFLAEEFSGSTVYIIGGTVAVNDRVGNALKAYGTVERISGATRYQTSANIAAKFFPDARATVFAYGQTFPDGLAGGPLAISLDAPLILTMRGKDAPAKEYVAGSGSTSGYVLGGPTLIPDATVEGFFGLPSGSVVILKK